MRRPPGRYDAVAVTFHWIVAAGVAAQFALGWWMVGLPEGAATPLGDPFDWHRALGLTLGAIILSRLAWRLARVPPAQLSSVPHPVGWFAELSHAIVYATLVLVPLTGLLGWLHDEDPLRDELFGRLHRVAGWVLAGLIALHVAAALWHLARRDGAFWRIFPRRLPR